MDQQTFDRTKKYYVTRGHRIVRLYGYELSAAEIASLIEAMQRDAYCAAFDIYC